MAKATKTKEDKLVLAVKKREVFGRKLKKLRAEGIIPGNVFGTDFKSQSLNANLREFVNIYKVARETGIVYLELDGKEIPVLIRDLHRHPVSGILLHVDFRKIDLKKKIATEVPVKAVGVSEAVSQKGGVLLTLSESLMVEALPQDIPQQIDVDISVLKEIGQEIKVADLPKSDKYELKEEPVKVVVSVVEHKEESITPETATTAPEVITEAAPVEGEAAPVEGAAQAKPEPEQKTEEKK
jgi:large subunit ribosomal protein L25